MTYSLYENKVDFGREILAQVAGGSYLSALHGSAQPRNEHVLSDVGLNSGIPCTIGEGQKVTVWAEVGCARVLRQFWRWWEEDYRGLSPPVTGDLTLCFQV